MNMEDKSKITIISMSGIYNKDDVLSEYIPDNCKINYIDCTDVRGTECYCDDAAHDIIKQRLSENDVTYRGIHFIDNGNYHYLSKIILETIEQPFNLLVIDNHPDTQHPAFGDILSCGGWVSDVCEKNPYLKKACLFGVKEELLPEKMRTIKNSQTVQDINSDSDAVSVACVEDEHPEDNRRCVEKEQFSEKIKAAGTAQDIYAVLDADTPVYISIDKDVLDASEYITNWDQGTLLLSQLESLITDILNKRNVCGADICGGMDMSMKENAAIADIKKNAAVDKKIISSISSLLL